MKLNIKSFIAGAVFSILLTGSVAFAANATSIDVYFQPLKYFFDGSEKKAPEDQQGFIYNGTTYVPLRFVSEALGKQVGYDGPTSSIYVGKQLSGQMTFLEDMKTLTSQFVGKDEYSFTNDFKSNVGQAYSHTLKYNTTWDRSRIAKIEYLLNGNYAKFEGSLVPDIFYSKQAKNDNIGSLKIYADDKLVYDSGVIASDITAPKNVSVNLTGALRVRFEFSSFNLGLVDAGFVS